MFIKSKLNKAIAATLVSASLAGYSSMSLGAIEEVVVMAQKRAQSVQDVPVTITSLNSEEIKSLGLQSAADVQFQTPGLIVSYSSSNAIPNFSLRGVGLNDFTAVQSSPVAIHVDNVYYGNSTLLNFALFDVDRVEVLKGPQGTLYGRNATGGAVNFFSAKPSDEFEVGLDLGVANYDTFTTEGFVSGGLTDNLMGRLSFTTTDQGGGPFDHDVHGEIGEKDSYAVRGQLLWDVTEDFTAHLTLFGGKDESDASQYQGVPTYTNDGSFGICPSVAAGSLLPSSDCSFGGFGAVQMDDDDPYTTQSGVINRDEIEAFGSSLELSWHMDDISVASITGYNEADRKSQEDADGSMLRNVDVGYQTEFWQFTEELRFSNEGEDGWKWTLGFFYSKDELEAPRTETSLADLFGVHENHAYMLETESYAAFMHNEINLSDTLTLVAGIRFTDEERSFEGGTIGTFGDDQFYDVSTTGGDFVYAPNLDLGGDYSLASFNNAVGATEYLSAHIDETIDFQKWSWRLGLNWDVSDSTLAYASISNGFKSGGFVGDITLQEILQEPYDEETLTATEVGIKSDLLDGTLRWNTSAFYYDYQDIILALTITGAGHLDTFLINDNGADATIYGVESDLWWSPTDNLDIKLGFTILETEFEAIEVQPFDVSDDVDGSELPYAPDFSANGLIRYEDSLTDNLLWSAQVDFTHRADHYAESQNSAINQLDGYTLFNLRFGLTSVDESWSAAIWMKNVADKEYYQYLNDLQGLGSVLTTPGASQTYGLDVSFRF